MVYPFENAALKANVGDITMPLEHVLVIIF
jgi:hypothetical protein